MSRHFGRALFRYNQDHEGLLAPAVRSFAQHQAEQLIQTQLVVGHLVEVPQN